MAVKRRIKSTGSAALLGLVADIRAAVGDPTGKLMQDELVEHCRKLRKERDWMAHLLVTIRDKADIRYGNNRGLLAFNDLKDEAARSAPNAEVSDGGPLTHKSTETRTRRSLR